MYYVFRSVVTSQLSVNGTVLYFVLTHRLWSVDFTCRYRCLVHVDLLVDSYGSVDSTLQRQRTRYRVCLFVRAQVILRTHMTSSSTYMYAQLPMTSMVQLHAQLAVGHAIASQLQLLLVLVQYERTRVLYQILLLQVSCAHVLHPKLYRVLFPPAHAYWPHYTILILDVKNLYCGGV